MYNRLKASPLYDIYSLVWKPEIRHKRNSELGFYRALLGNLGPDSIIFDVGANHGQKTDIFLRLGARVISVEPDLLNQKILAEKFHALRFKRKPVTIVGKALSRSESVAQMWIEKDGSAKNTLSNKWASTLREDIDRFGHALKFERETKVQTTTLDHLIEAYGKPSFVKIDVEGHEIAVLEGLSSAVPCLSFETNLPEFREEGAQCIKHLANLQANTLFNYSAHLGKGFPLDRWVTVDKFLAVYERCSEPTIEIFARAGSS